MTLDEGGHIIGEGSDFAAAADEKRKEEEETLRKARHHRFRDLMRRLKYDYLNERKDKGGHNEGFRDYVRKYRREHPDDFKDFDEEVLDLACRPVWDQKKRPDGTADLFLDGKPCEDEISFRDESVPGKH